MVPHPTSSSTSKKILRNGTTAALVTLSTLGALSVVRAVAATATIPIVAQLLRAIEVTVNTSLNFGTLAMTNETAPGSARLDPATSRLTTDPSGSLTYAGGVPKAGRVVIKGAPFPVNVTIAQETMQINNGPEFMTVSDFRLMTADGGPTMTVTPSGPGNMIAVNVGASIRTRPQQTQGVYTGVNTIHANYQ